MGKFRRVGTLALCFVLLCGLVLPLVPSHIAFATSDITSSHVGSIYTIQNSYVKIDLEDARPLWFFNITNLVTGNLIFQNMGYVVHSNMSGAWSDFSSAQNWGVVTLTNTSITNGYRFDFLFTTDGTWRPQNKLSFELYNYKGYFQTYLSFNNSAASVTNIQYVDFATLHATGTGGFKVGTFAQNMTLYPSFSDAGNTTYAHLYGVTTSWDSDLPKAEALMVFSNDTNEGVVLGLPTTANMSLRLSLTDGVARVYGLQDTHFYLRCATGTTVPNALVNVSAGASYTSDKLFIGFTGNNPLTAFSDYTSIVAAQNTFNPSLSSFTSGIGYSTWYPYSAAITQAKVLTDLNYFAANFSNAKMFEIDDGWEPYYGDWTANLTAFPSDMTFMASQITGKGLVAGIWVAPWYVSHSSALFAAHPDWLLKTAAGAIYNDSFTNSYLDPTNPNTDTFLAGVFTNLTTWGYTHVKIDFTPWNLFPAATYGFNRSMTWIQALNDNLVAIRTVAPNVQIANNLWGWFNGNAAVSMQTFRFAADIGGTLASMLPSVLRFPYFESFQGNTTAYLDLDSIVGGDRGMTDSQIKMWDTLVWMSGSVLSISTDFNTPNATQIAWLKAITANSHAGVAPLIESYTGTYPQVMLTSGTPTNSSNHFLFLANWNGTSGSVSVDLSTLPALTVGNSYLLTDFWNSSHQEMINSTTFTETLAADSFTAYTIQANMAYLTFSAGTGGSIDKATGWYVGGTSITIHATDATGYDFFRWTENGVQVESLPVYTFTPTTSATIAAEFIAQSTDGSGGNGGNTTTTTTATSGNGTKPADIIAMVLIFYGGLNPTAQLIFKVVAILLVAFFFLALISKEEKHRKRPKSGAPKIKRIPPKLYGGKKK